MESYTDESSFGKIELGESGRYNTKVERYKLYHSKNVYKLFDLYIFFVSVNKKYEDFYNKNGYYPKYFLPLDCKEVTNDICPTILASVGRIGRTSLLILVDCDGEDNNGDQ